MSLSFRGAIFFLWAPNDAVYVERIFCDDSFIEDAVSKARAFYFDKFLPSLLPYVIISDSREDRFAVTTTEVVQICDSAEVSDDVKVVDNFEACDDVEVKIVGDSEASDDVEILSVSNVPSLTSHMNVLQQLHYRKHEVSGDGNCLYYAVAHQAGYIGHSSRGDIFMGKQLRMLALMTMQKYPGVRIEDGLLQHQWEQKTSCI